MADKTIESSSYFCTQYPRAYNFQGVFSLEPHHATPKLRLPDQLWLLFGSHLSLGCQCLVSLSFSPYRFVFQCVASVVKNLDATRLWQRHTVPHYGVADVGQEPNNPLVRSINMVYGTLILREIPEGNSLMRLLNRPNRTRIYFIYLMDKTYQGIYENRLHLL